MRHPLLNCLSFLRESEISRIKDFRKASDLLCNAHDPEIWGILVGKSWPLDFEGFDHLLQDVANSVNDHKSVRSITDWPFENFWTNPHEPKHSKLLGYLIDPQKDHGCGGFLLGKLFDVLRRSGCFPVEDFQIDACRVTVEDKGIDILITCDCDTSKFAVIIENKINWAVNQDKQLQRYVEIVKKRGFDPKQICVLYLPLTTAKDPEPADVKAIIECGVSYKKVTFLDHILKWLDEVLEGDNSPEFKNSSRDGMRENLRHYRNLIRYLDKQNKKRQMKSEIIERLKQADKKGNLPSWQQVKSMVASAEALKSCLEATLRSEMLLLIQKRLNEMGCETFFTSQVDSVGSNISDSRYAPRLMEEKLILHVRIDKAEAITVSLGIMNPQDAEILWIGYGKRGTLDKQNGILQYVERETESCLDRGDDEQAYMHRLCAYVTYDNCIDNSIIMGLANDLKEMRDRMHALLRNSVYLPNN